MLPVSVVIPTHNRAATLVRAIASVVRQKHAPHELIVVDDGSTDTSRQQVEALAAHHSSFPIHYVPIRHGGVSCARNVGIDIASAPWVAFLDSDDEWLPEKLEQQVLLAQKRPDLRVIHGDEIWIRSGVRIFPQAKHKKSGGWIYSACVPLCAISPSTVMIHKSVFTHVGKFNEAYPVCEDYDLWCRVTPHYEVGFVNAPIIVKYGGHADQLSRRFQVMDYWRVKTLAQCLQNGHLLPEQRILTAGTLRKKAAIVLRGCQKHGNDAVYAEVIDIFSLAGEILKEYELPLESPPFLTESARDGRSGISNTSRDPTGV